MKKTITLALLAALCLSSFAACGSGETTETDNTSVDTSAGTEVQETETEASYEMPEADMEGWTFQLLNLTGPHCSWLTYPCMDAQEVTGEKINDTVYERNRFMEEELNFTFAEVVDENAESTIKKSIQAGEDQFQTTIQYGNTSLALALEGQIWDLCGIDTIQLDKPWWNQGFVDSYMVKNKLFFGIGSGNLSDIDETSAVFVNKTILDSIAGGTNLYEEVREGTWSLDRLLSLAEQGTIDTNGDGSVVYKEDQNGLVTINLFPPSLYFSGGDHIIGRDGEGNVINSMTDQHFVDVFMFAAENFYNREVTFYHTGANNDVSVPFSEGKALFMLECIGKCNEMREMNDDYGILPVPKYDAAQDQYYTYSCSQYYMSIPITNLRSADAGLILDVMMGLSEYELKHIYLDEVLGGKFSRDQETKEMLNTYILPYIIYDYGARVFSFGNTLNTMVMNGDTDIASKAASMSDKVEAELEKFVNIQ